ERRQCRKRDHQGSWHFLERKADLKSVVLHLQAPELVLKDDCHFVGVALLQEGRDVHAWIMGLERQIEMMPSDKPLLFGTLERLLDDRTQSAVRKRLVADVVFCHG